MQWFMHRSAVLFIASALAGQMAKAADTVDPSIWVPAQWPRECHGLVRHEFGGRETSAVPAAIARHYEKQLHIHKVDVVCMSDDLVISEPVFTNGGNFVAYATRIRIEAPIDTRVYRRHDFYDNFIDAAAIPEFGARQTAPGAQVAGGWASTGKVFSSASSDSLKKLRSSYEDYYGCWNCRRLASGAATPSLPNGFTNPTWAWQIVRPHQSSYGARSVQGAMPPDEAFDFPTFRSGSTYLFAKEVDVPSSEVAIVASGARGGRGGAGTPDSCTAIEYTGWKKFQCHNNDYSGAAAPALNAPGGRGGDAGSVFVKVVSQDDEQRRLIAAKSRADGGRPGPSERLTSPVNTYTALKSGTLQDFNVTGTWPDALAGASGTISVQPGKAEDLLADFLHVVLEMEKSSSYNYSELVERARRDSTRDVVDFDDYVYRQLNEFRRQQLKSLVVGARDLFKSAESVKRSGQPLLCERHSMQAVSAKHRSVLLRLGSLCGPPEFKVSHHLSSTAGLLRIERKDVLSDVASLDIESAILGSAEVWNTIAAEVKNLDARLIDVYVSVEKSRLSSEIRHARERLAVAQSALAALKKHESEPAIARVVRTAGGLSRVFDFADAIEGVYEKGITLPGLEKVGERAPKAGAAIREFLEAQRIAKSSSAGLHAEVRAALGQLGDLEAQLSLLQEEMRGRRQEVVNEATQHLRSALNARAVHANQKQARLNYFDDVFKLVVLDRVLNGSLGDQRFQQNLVALDVFLSPHWSARPLFQLGSDLPSCFTVRQWFLWNACPVVPAQSGIDMYLASSTLLENGQPLLLSRFPPGPRRSVENYLLPVTLTSTGVAPGR